MRTCTALKAAWICAAVSITITGQATSQSANSYGIGAPSAVSELPAGDFRDALLALDPNARGRALGILRGGEFTDADLPFLRVDRRGGVFFEDPVFAASGGEEVLSPPAEISSLDAFALHSKPGAPKTVYIDFDGHAVSGTIWNDPFEYPDAPTTYQLKAYDTDGSGGLSDAEINVIADVWRRMAEDFAPYDVDVTTEEPPFTINASRNDRIDYGPDVGHIVVTRKVDENGFAIYSCSCGGVAYYGGYGDDYYSPGLVFLDSVSGATGIAESASHELGHNLYLAHDGTSGSAYYTGHGTGNVSWAPIMGVGYYTSVTQWSKGEYSGANNTEDDLNKITVYLPYRLDDHEDTDLALATPLTLDGGVSATSLGRVTDPTAADTANKGIIEDLNDIDLFFMDVGAGTVDLTITPGYFEEFTTAGNRGMNLDIEARLLDEFGSVVATANPDAETDARIIHEVSVPGIYYLEITGVGRGDPLSGGYTDYASIGQYYINGTVPAGVVQTSAPTAPDDLTADLVDAVNIALNWSDPASTPETDEYGYHVLRSVDGGDFSQIASLPRDATGYADNNLVSGDYSYRLLAFNSVGNNETGATSPIFIDIPTISVATSEATAAGSIQSGSYLDTQTTAGSETLQERESGGKPSNRYSYLDHTWTVTGVAPGASVNLSVTASAPANGEGDDFVFSYSVNGGASIPLGTVMNGAGALTMTADLGGTTKGSVAVNVVDNDSSKGARALDSVTVHEIIVASAGDPEEQPPAIAITSPSDGLKVESDTSLTFIGSAEDFEDGDLSGAISWDSDVDGYLGTGSSVVAVLSGTIPAVIHNVTASVTDSAGNTETDTIVVTVDDTPAPVSIAVADLDGSAVASGRNKWQADVTVTVHDNTGQPVAGVLVEGGWSNGSRGGGSCTTSATGVCVISKSGLGSKTASVVFTVSGLSGTLPYASGDNSDPDGDSDGARITVTAP